MKGDALVMPSTVGGVCNKRGALVVVEVEGRGTLRYM